MCYLEDIKKLCDTDSVGLPFPLLSSGSQVAATVFGPIILIIRVSSAPDLIPTSDLIVIATTKKPVGGSVNHQQPIDGEIAVTFLGPLVKETFQCNFFLFFSEKLMSTTCVYRLVCDYSVVEVILLNPSSFTDITSLGLISRCYLHNNNNNTCDCPKVQRTSLFSSCRHSGELRYAGE